MLGDRDRVRKARKRCFEAEIGGGYEIGDWGFCLTID